MLFFLFVSLYLDKFWAARNNLLRVFFLLANSILQNHKS